MLRCPLSPSHEAFGYHLNLDVCADDGSSQSGSNQIGPPRSGTSTPVPATATGSSMRVRFTSDFIFQGDGSNHRTGFAATMTCVVTTCNGNQGTTFLNSTSGSARISLISYTDNNDCYWSLSCSGGLGPRLTFTSLSTEQKSITSCSASTHYSSGYVCQNVFALANEWAIAGSNNGAAPIGSWIKLNFAAAQAVNTLKFAQRGSDTRSRDLRVEFSDGSTTVVTVADDTLLHSFSLPATTTTFVKLTIQTTYSAATDSNTGAKQIELWGPFTSLNTEQKSITSCSASTHYSSGYVCQNVFALANEWAIAGSNNGAAPIGSWIKLNFAAAQAVNTLKFAQRSTATGLDTRSRDLRVEFSDGSTTVVTVADDTLLHSFSLPATTTTFVKLTIQTTHSTGSSPNTGAKQIELWGPQTYFQKPITSCSASTHYSSGYVCQNVFALANEWAIAGSNNGAAPVGSWIKLNFAAAQAVNILKFAQRPFSTGVVTRSRDLRVEFSDGSTTVVTVADDTLLHSFPLPATTTTFVKLTIQTTYSAGTDSNTGAKQIELWGPNQDYIYLCTTSCQH
jgi:hypothetical protein